MTRYNVLIASYLEPEHVERIRRLDSRLHVVYEPGLLAPPRFPSDHSGKPFARTAEQEKRWRTHLGEADVLFDFDRTHLEDLPQLAGRVRWIQATSAGIGQLVKHLEYDVRMPRTVFTTASGVHARPLAEFCVLAVLTFAKRWRRTLGDQADKRWERHANPDLEGRTLAIVGAGAIGREVARLARALGMRVVGTKRRPSGIEPAALHLDILYPAHELPAVLEQADYLVLAAPHTPETEGMIGVRELALLPRGAVLINVGRGALIDEPALIEALAAGRLGGAALDVFAEEPLPVASPLWEMPQVLVSPHSASTSERENERLTDLFRDNLRRFLAGEPLLNVLDPARYY